MLKLPVTLRVFSSFIEPVAPCSNSVTLPEEPASKSFVPDKRISCAVPAAEVVPPKVIPPVAISLEFVKPMAEFTYVAVCIAEALVAQTLNVPAPKSILALSR